MADHHLIGQEIWIFSWYPLYETKPQARMYIYYSKEAAEAIQSQYIRAGGYSTYVQSARIMGHPTDWMGREI